MLSDTSSLLAACAAAVQAVCRSGPLMQVGGETRERNRMEEACRSAEGRRKGREEVSLRWKGEQADPEPITPSLFLCEQADPVLCTSALLALTKLMAADGAFCEANMQLFFGFLSSR